MRPKEPGRDSGKETGQKLRQGMDYFCLNSGTKDIKGLGLGLMVHTPRCVSVRVDEFALRFGMCWDVLGIIYDGE